MPIENTVDKIQEILFFFIDTNEKELNLDLKKKEESKKIITSILTSREFKNKLKYSKDKEIKKELTKEEIKKLDEIDPVYSDEAKEIRNKLNDVLTEIKAKAYFITNDDMEISISEEERFVFSHTPLSIIISHIINGSTTLLEGGTGTGKTMITKIISRMMTGTSINNPINVFYLDDEITKEQWMGYPDIEKIQDKENPRFEIKWAECFDDPNIIDYIADEINRANTKTQNQFLSMMAESLIQYGVHFKKKLKDFRLYLTQNPLDEGEGTHKLQKAFKDRITQYITVPNPPSYAMKKVFEERKDERRYGYDIDERVKPIMEINDLRVASIFADNIPLTNNALNYAIYLTRDVSLCLKAKKYDKTLSRSNFNENLCKDCHFGGDTTYNCKKFSGGGSMRIFKDLIAVSKAYAFFLGESRVNEFLIRSIALDVINHRIEISNNAFEEDSKYNNKDDFIKQYLIDWAWTKLMDRKEAEDAYEALYKGDGSDKDVETLLRFSNNDLYVRIDLLPRVIRIKGDLSSNLEEDENKEVLSSTADVKYKKCATRINNINKSVELDLMEKWNKLETIKNEIIKEKIPFKNNLIDIIYPIFDDLRLKIIQKEKNVKREKE